MRLTATKSSGFTLVEVLIISPVVILFIGAFIGLLVSLTGESLVIRERNLAVYETQNALDDIETTVSQATGFLVNTNGIAISPPQGKNNTDAAFTNNNGVGEPETLIVKSAATTKRSNDPTRALIYMGSGACDSKNPMYEYLAIYFVALDSDTADPNDKALYKRTIMPQFAACAAPRQKGSCEASTVAANSSVCKATDEKLVSGVSTLDVSYYIGASATAAADTEANSATDVSVNLSVTKKIAGNTVSNTGNTRTNSLNIQSSNGSGIGGGGTVATAPANPAVQWTRNDLGPTPYRTTVTWGSIGNANNYTVKYRIGGGAEQNLTIGQSSNPSANLDASARKQTVLLVDIVVNTDTGSFSYGPMPSITSIPRWNECSMQGGWQWYGAPYNTMGFTKTTRGAVGLKGLIKLGTVGAVTCTLPAGFAPEEHIMFEAPTPNAAGNDQDFARVDIYPNGNIAIAATPGSNNFWVSMDGIIFMTASGNPAWTAGSYASPWYFYSYNDGYSNLKYYQDSLGRAWVQGLATGGAGYGSGQTMGWMSAAMTPQYGGLHIPTTADNRAAAVNINGSPAIASRPSFGSYTSTQYLYYSIGGLPDLALYNGWYNYLNGWSLAKCNKGTDDIVILQGLVAGGNPAAGGMAGVHGCGTTPGMSTGYDAILPAWRNWERAARVDLRPDNYLYPISVDTGWTSLDGTHYIAD